MTDEQFKARVLDRLLSLRIESFVYGAMLSSMFLRGCDEKPCGHKCTASAPQPTVAAPDTIFAKGETSRKVSAKVGDVVIVKIPCSPSSGYRWSVASIPDGKLAEDGESKFEEIDKGDGEPTVGSSGYQVFQFKVMDGGDIELEYKQPFDRDARAKRFARVEVEIKGARP